LPAVDLASIDDPFPVPPGSYRLYAFKTVDGLEYENSAVLSRFLGRNVVLDADKTTTIALDVVNEFP
jgi:hypothetical protein